MRDIIARKERSETSTNLSTLQDSTDNILIIQFYWEKGLNGRGVNVGVGDTEQTAADNKKR